MFHPQLSDAIATLREVAQGLPIDKYVNVFPDEVQYGDGSTFLTVYSDLHEYLDRVCQFLGMGDVGYTFRMVQKRKGVELKQYVNLPNVRLINGEACLCWGKVNKPITELMHLSPTIGDKAATKQGMRPSYFIEFPVPRKQRESLNIGGSVQFAIALDPSKEVEKADLIECLKGDLEWSEVMKDTSGSYTEFPKSCSAVFGTDEQVVAIAQKAIDEGMKDLKELFYPVQVTVISEPTDGNIGAYETVVFDGQTDTGETHKLWMFKQGMGSRLAVGAKFTVEFKGLRPSKKNDKVYPDTRQVNFISSLRVKYGTASLAGINFTGEMTEDETVEV
jgi:hypothetical protein